jgi:cyanophycinase
VLKRWLAFGLVLSVVAPLGAAPTGGHLVLIGGGERPPEVMRAFVRLAGGPAAPIVLIPTASEDPTAGPERATEFREQWGCTDVSVLEVRSCADASRPDYVAAAERARGIYFLGGDQTRIVNAFAGSPVLAAIERAFRGGAALGGTSAGTACMSPLMITGEGDFDVVTADNVELWPGLGFFRGVIVDQHFVARRRQNRLLAVILEHPALLGVGVDEETAVWVRPDGTFEVLGRGTVTVIDAGDAAVVRAPGAAGHDVLGGHGLRLDLLVAGDGYDLVSRSVVPRWQAGPPAPVRR